MTSEDRRNTLENRLKTLEIYKKMQEIKADSSKYAEEQEKRRLENKKIELEIKEKEKTLSHGKSGRMFDLIMAAHTYCIDEDKTIGSEIRLKNLFDRQELEGIKKLIKEELLKSR